MQLVEQGFHTYLETTIKKDQVVACRKLCAKIYGFNVLPTLIKLKKYREHFTEFVASLRLSKNFRDRQMYVTIAKASFKAENEVFKKHFAKNIGNDMCGEKVKVVQIALAKLVMKVPLSYSRSSDKIRDHLLSNTSADVKQFLVKNNQLKFICTEKLTV